jgi:sugar transferase (PEP-CTERM/EpsH1 system associated)
VFPYPPNDGGRIRIYHILQALCARHEITFAGLQDQEDDAFSETAENLARYCSRVVSLGHRARPADFKKRRAFFDQGLGRALSSPLPELLREPQSQALAALRELMARTQFDVCHVEHFGTLRYLPAVSPEHRPPYFTLDLDNVESVVARRQIDVLSSKRIFSEWRLMQQLDWLKLIFWERRILKRFNLCFVCSENDERLLHRQCLTRKTLIVPNGVDAGFFRPDKERKEIDGRIVFSGHMSYEPNVDAVRYFSREIYPYIKREMPAASLWVVGKAPAPTVQCLHDGRQTVVTGTVEDIRPYLQESMVAAVPLRVGGGTRLKILEAMALGKVVVSTSIGCEGLDVTHGKHIFVCDDPRAFAQTCIQLLRSPLLRRRVGDAARRLVCEKYDWAKIRAELAESYARNLPEQRSRFRCVTAN